MKLRRYETVFIIHPDLNDEEVSALTDRYCDIIAAYKGVLVKVDRWGKRKLAYLIRKQSKGTYVLLDYAGSSAVVSEMERNFKIDDHVLKYMTILKNENVSLSDLEKEVAQSKDKAADSTGEASGAPSETRAPLTVVSATSAPAPTPTPAPAPAPEQPAAQEQGE
ncbi:MAG: 30S ribosomal protein S6 [Syntrophales bacterium]